MAPSPRPRRLRAAALGAAAAAILLAILLSVLRGSGGPERGVGAPVVPPTPLPAAPWPEGAPPPIDLGPRPPSTGWEEAAEEIVADLEGLLAGRARRGAFADAQAEAARRDLARYPPEPWRVRRMLLGSTRERCWALAAVAALPEVDDDLARLVLRSLRPDDDDLQRLLTAEAVAALPPGLLSRHEDDLLAVFEAERNPLVLAEALPALERMDVRRLRILVERQLALATPQMLPILVALARDRLRPEDLAEVGILVTAPAPGSR